MREREGKEPRSTFSVREKAGAAQVLYSLSLHVVRLPSAQSGRSFPGAPAGGWASRGAGPRSHAGGGSAPGRTRSAEALGTGWPLQLCCLLTQCAPHPGTQPLSRNRAHLNVRGVSESLGHRGRNTEMVLKPDFRVEARGLTDDFARLKDS